MKYAKPFQNCKPTDLTQGFFPKQHEANDWKAPYGTFICAPFNAKVANIVGVEKDEIEKVDGSLNYTAQGCGIRLISTEDPTISISYWHCTSAGFTVNKGDIVLQGQPIAQVGNTGMVYGNGTFYTAEEREVEYKASINVFPKKGVHAHISMGQLVNGVYTSLDYSKLIDWSIPVKFNAFFYVMMLINKIKNLLK